VLVLTAQVSGKFGSCIAWQCYITKNLILSMAYMKNVLIDSELSRRLPFRPRGNTGGPRLSKALDGYVAANLCPQTPYKAKS
jgi:hypothetical protein